MAEQNSPTVGWIGLGNMGAPLAGRLVRAGYDVDWSSQLKHGERIGLGSMDYELVEIPV